MACNCIETVDKLLKETFNDSAITDTTFSLNGTLRMSIKGMFHKINKKNEYQKKWNYVNLQATYCPFCGKPY